MESPYNEEKILIDTEESLKYPTIPQNNIIFMLFKGLVLTPESIWPLNTFLEKKKFNKDDVHYFDNIRENLKETYEKSWFIWMDTNIIIDIIDKLYDYYTKYKNLLLKDIDELKEGADSFDLDYRLASIQASRTAEEYLIQMLQMKNILGLWIENEEFCLDEYRLRLERLILDYFWDFERESKYLADLEKEYKDNSIKIDTLQHDVESNSNALRGDLEVQKLDNYLIKLKRDVAKNCVWKIKDEIYRLVRWSETILSKDLLSKLGKYQTFSELLVENDRKVSEIIEVE